MEYLPIELQNKIIFPKYYIPIDSYISLNEKIIIGHNLNKLKMITEQINSLFKEYIYKKNNSNFEIIKQSKFVRFILMKNLSKKKFKSPKQTSQIYNTFNNICFNTCSNNTYLNTNNTYLNTNNTYLNTNNINYNYFNSITTYLN